MMPTSVKPGPNESESCRELMKVETLDLVWPLILMRSRQLSPALIEFEPAQILLRVAECFLSGLARV